MRSLLRASAPVVVAIAIAIGVFGPPSAAGAVEPAAVQSGGVGIRLLDVPVDGAHDPRAKQYIVDNLKPGTTIERRIEVSNTTTDTLHVSVYPDAAAIVGGAFVGGAGHTTNELTSWTSMSQAVVDVPAGGVVRDTVTIVVPADAAPGERYGVVWAEVATSGGSISQVERAGIRVYLSVGGSNPTSSFTVTTLTAARTETGQPTVLAQVRNTGQRALDLTGTLALKKVSGAVAVGPYPVVLGTTLAPGQSEPVRIIIPDELVNGPWDATVVLTSGVISETARGRITFPSGAGSAPATPAQNGGFPWPVVLAVLACTILLVAVVLFIVAARRRARRGAD